MKIHVKCNEEAMRYWSLQYGPFVEVLEPKQLRERIKEDVNNMSEKYNKYGGVKYEKQISGGYIVWKYKI